MTAQVESRQVTAPSAPARLFTAVRDPGSIAEAASGARAQHPRSGTAAASDTLGLFGGTRVPTPAWPEEQAPPSSQVLGPRGPLQAEGVPPRSRTSPLLVSTAPSGLGRGDLEQPPGRRGQLSQSSGERAWRPRRRGLGGGERHRAGGHGRGALPDPAALGRGQAVAVGRAAAEQQQVERGAEWATDLVCDLPTWMQTLLRFTTCFPSPSPEHGPGPLIPPQGLEWTSGL